MDACKEAMDNLSIEIKLTAGGLSARTHISRSAMSRYVPARNRRDMRYFFNPALEGRGRAIKTQAIAIQPMMNAVFTKRDT